VLERSGGQTAVGVHDNQHRAQTEGKMPHAMIARAALAMAFRIKTSDHFGTAVKSDFKRLVCTVVCIDHLLIARAHPFAHVGDDEQGGGHAITVRPLAVRTNSSPSLAASTSMS
jgi:hypothetical protein